MGSTKKILATVPAAFLAATVAFTGSATAADLLVDPPVYEAPEIVTKSSGGWYLRGDITYDFNEVQDPSYRNTAAWAVGRTAFTSHETDDAFDIGIGVGYQINEYFRVDLTAEHVFEADFTATSGCPTTCAAVDTSSFTTTKLLANAYVDMGNFSGFTPYLGAGLGGAYVQWNDLVGAGNEPGNSEWRFAWALHAGVSYDIAESFKLDLGYSYSHIHGGTPFDSGGTTPNLFFDEGITSHVLRAGVRYTIW